MAGKSAIDQAPCCILCKHGRADVFKDNANYYQCRECGGVFVWPVRPQQFYLQTDTYLSDPKQYAGGINLQGQRWMIEQFERLYKQKTGHEHKGSLLEVGAGAGYLTLFAIARGWDAFGIETSHKAVKYGQDFLRVPLEHSILEKYTPKKDFDAVAMVEVLEHFLDPVHAIQAIKKLIKKPVFLFGTTPKTDSSHWKESEQNIYEPDDHIFLFNHHALEHFGRRAGLKQLTVEPFGSGKENDSNLMYAGMVEPA